MRPFRYAIIGFGNVGAALAGHAAERADRVASRYGVELRLVAALDSTAAVVDERGLDGRELARWRESGRRLEERDGAHPVASVGLADVRLDCVCVCLPTNRETGEPGLTWARAALAAGAGLVLADKGPALVALPELEAEAARRGTFVGASATVGGALPSLSVARRELAGAELREISAILNGTSNMILTLMRERGVAFDDALAEALRLGIAEPDPSYDVRGWDTAVKLTILTRSLLDPSVALADVDRCGIDELDPRLVETASATGGRVRLVGRARPAPGGTRLSVAPEVVAPTDPFYLVDGAYKAAKFVSDDLGELVVMGGASGRRDVAASMLKDMLSDPRIPRIAANYASSE
jgi:homoserine dehydrogenase